MKVNNPRKLKFPDSFIWDNNERYELQLKGCGRKIRNDKMET
jgi:hypothetical protein